MSFTGNKNFKQFSQSLIGLKLKKNKLRNKEENKKEDNNNDELGNLLNKLKASQMKINNITNSIIGDVYLNNNKLNTIQEETNFNNIPLAQSKLISIEEENDDNNNNYNENNNNNNINNNNNNINNINNNNNNNNNDNNKKFYNNFTNFSPVKLKSVSQSVFNNNFNPINKIEDDIDTNVDFTIINYFKYNDKKAFLEEKKELENKKIEEELLRRKKENEELKKEIEEIQKEREEQERKNKENEEKLKKQIEENEIKKKEEEEKELLRKLKEEEEEKERKLNEEEIRLQRELLEKENEEEKKIQRIKQERLEREKKERLEKERKEKEKKEKEKKEKEKIEKEKIENKNLKIEKKISEDDIEIQEISNSYEEEIQTNINNKNNDNNIFKSKPNIRVYNENESKNNINNDKNSSNEELKVKLNSETKKEIENIKKKNEDLLSKLNEDEKKEIERVINNIYSFDTDNPNLSKKDSFYIIKSLDKEDIEINELINDFEENVVKLENKDITKKRRKNFLNKNYFNYKIDFNSQFQQFMTSNRLPHPNYMNKAYQSCNFKEELPHINDNFEDDIFNKNNLNDKILSPISNLENFETFVYKYSCLDNYKLMISANKNFNLWRKCIFDGNSFYRVFMFCLIENYILNNNIKELETLIAELIYEKNIDLYNKNNIDTETFLIILAGLRKYLNENKTEKTYDLFLKSYLLKNQCFDKALIIYLRNVIFKYLTEVYEEEELYYKEKKLNYKNKKINLEAIKFFGIEPEFVILNYITYLYNVNLNILYIDSDFNNPKDNIIPIIDSESDNILITIGFFFLVIFHFMI